MNIINANDLELRNKKQKVNQLFALQKQNQSYFNDNGTATQKYSENEDCLRICKSIENSYYSQSNLSDGNDYQGDDIDSLFNQDKHSMYQKADFFVKKPINNRSLSPIDTKSHTSISRNKDQHHKIFSPERCKEGGVLQMLREKNKLNNQQQQDSMNVDSIPISKRASLKPKMYQSKKQQIQSHQSNKVKPINSQWNSTKNVIRSNRPNDTKRNIINEKSKICKTEYNKSQKSTAVQKSNQKRPIKTKIKKQDSNVQRPTFTPNLSKNSLLQMSNCTYDVIARNKLWLQMKQQKLNKIRKDQEQQRLKKQEENSHVPITTHYKADKMIKSNNYREKTSINYGKKQVLEKKIPILEIAKVKQRQYQMHNLSLNIGTSKQKIIYNAKKSPIPGYKQKKQSYEQAVKELHQKIMKMKI